MGQFVSRLNRYQADETKESGWRPRNSSCFQWLGESRILGNSGGSSFIVQLLLLKGIREISVVAQKTKLYPAPLKEKRERVREVEKRWEKNMFQEGSRAYVQWREKTWHYQALHVSHLQSWSIRASHLQLLPPHPSSKTPTVMHQFNQMIRYFLNFFTFVIQSTLAVPRASIPICISINPVPESIYPNLQLRSTPQVLIHWNSFQFIGLDQSFQ